MFTERQQFRGIAGTSSPRFRFHESMFSSKTPSRILSCKSLVARSYFVLSVVSFLFSGCISDPITGPEVRARLVLPPQRVMFSSPVSSFVAPATGDMVIRWTRSPADTQLNFKGYYVQLWTSEWVIDASPVHQDSQKLIQLIDTAHVLKVTGRLDTSVTFRSLPMGTYTAFVWGEKATDTLGYSLDYAKWSFYFDPRPLQNPTNLQATSISTNTVALKWDYPASHLDSGSRGYVIYYRNPDIRNDSAHFGGSTRGNDTNSWTVNLPPLPSQILGAVEHEYQMWVKSIRNDSTFFYSDSNTVVWAGAERLPTQGGDSSIHPDSTHSIPVGSFRLIRHSIIFENVNSQWEVADDSGHTDQQITITPSGQSVILTAATDVSFSSQIDQARSLDTLFYSTPITSGFNQSSLTLDPAPDDLGRVIYVQLTDRNRVRGNKPEWARIFILHQSDGTFINPTMGGIDIQASYQPGVTPSIDAHLPYY